jgi:PadR family transcriptional regulator, regulatory protein PadR
MGSPGRISLQLLKVLRVLLSDPNGDHYGLELARASGLPSGTVYPILVRLEQAGWLTSAWEDIDEAAEGRRRRRYYRLTAEGLPAARGLLQETQAVLAAPKASFPQSGWRPRWGEATP